MSEIKVGEIPRIEAIILISLAEGFRSPVSHFRTAPYDLPMIIAIAHNRQGHSVAEIADMAKSAGQRSISLASELLKPTENK